MAAELRPETLCDRLEALRRAARGLCASRDEADELVQETCVRVLARRRAIASEAAALPYLLTVLRHTFVSELRSRERRPGTAPLDVAAAWAAEPGGRGPAVVLEAREVVAAVATLPAAQRRAVAAVDVAGLSYAEAARALGVPTGTVMSRLHRGRAAVARRLGG